LFSDLSYRVVSVSGGADAISKSKEMRPDIVVADVSLPNGDGYEVSGKIKGDPDLEGTSVILLASSLGVFDEMKAAEALADDFMIKPLKSEKIITKVESLINQHEEREKSSAFNLLPPAEEAIEKSDGFEMLNNEGTTHGGEPGDYGSYRETEYKNGAEEIKIGQEASEFDEEIILLEEDCESYGEGEYKNGTEEIKIGQEVSEFDEEIIPLEEEFIEHAPDTELNAKEIETLDEKSKTEIVDKVSEIVIKRLSEVIPESISKVVDSVLKEEIKKIK
jgi:DNA-binding response OmpR family regulator